MTADLRAHLQSSLGDAYTVQSEIGGGGMSHVYIAEDTALRRRIVVKVLPPELAGEVGLARFQREITLAARLQHPHIIPLLACGETEGLPYYTMPFVEGESLRQRLDRVGELPVAEAVRLLREIASALAYAHDNGVVHRDIKPANVLLSGGIALVADFGVAKALIASSATDGTLTSVGIVVGTPSYMAPEQVSADPALDHRADLYSFGMVAYEMLAGHPPFAGRSAQALLVAHVIEAPEPLEKRRPTVPPALAALVMQCLEKRAADRPQGANEIVRALDALVTPPGTVAAAVAASVAASVEAPKTSGRRVSIAALGALAIVLIAAAGAGWLAFSHRTRAVASAPRLLIAPFENLTGDPSLDYIGRLAADQLATGVGSVGSTDVVAADVVFLALRDTTRPAAVQLKRLADATHASLLVSGTFARQGDSLTVSAHVRDVRTDDLVHTFEPATRPMADPVGAVNLLGDHLLGWLNIRGIAAIPQRGYRAPNAAAAQEFARALGKVSRVEFRRFLERAIALDSTFVRAYLVLATGYATNGDSTGADSLLRRVEGLPQRITAGEQATLDNARALLRHDLQGQLQSLSRLAALDSSPIALRGVGQTAIALLQPDLAVRALEHSYAAALVIGGEEAKTAATNLPQAYNMAGAYDRTLRLARDQRAKTPDTGVLAGWQLRAYAGLARGGEAALALADTMARAATADSLGDVLLFVGLWGALEFRAHGDTATASQLLKIARDWMASHPEPAPIPVRQLREGMLLLGSRMPDSAAVRFTSLARDPRNPQGVGFLALTYAARGDKARARVVADSLGRSSHPSGADEFWRAAIVGALGDREQAVQLLRKASSDGQGMQQWHYHVALESLHGYPAFEELVRPKR